MAAKRELLEFGAAELSEQFRSRKLSPVEVTDAYVERILELQPRLNAYITVVADLAHAAAEAAENEIMANSWRGPFHGVPVALKDLCYTRGILTTGGSKILADFEPEYDCTVWTRLKSQGAVLLGKLNLHEFAYGVTSTNPHFGPSRNPYDLQRIPGGSSGGSAAAIVAGMAAATIGTDTGGSIRIPAAFCGCVGLKPTWSRVSRFGVLPLSDSMDHVGPITRTVRDAALMLGAIAGHDPNDATSSREPVPDYASALKRDIKGVRVGVVAEFQSGIDSEVAKGIENACSVLRSLGAVVDAVSVPTLDAAVAVFPVVAAEALEYHERWLRERPQDYGEDVLERLNSALVTMAPAYVRAQRARSAVLAGSMRALEGCDVLLCPVTAIAAPRIAVPSYPVDENGQPVDIFEQIVRFTMPFDATGQPALAIPTGMSKKGLPLSMQFVGRPFDEMTVIRVANAYERARGPLPAPKL